MRRLKLLSIFIILLIVGAACSNQDAQNIKSTQPGETAGSSPEKTATNLPVIPTSTSSMPAPSDTPPANESASDPDELPPLSFDEILEAGIEEGTWTEGEALVLFMKYFVGEVSEDEIPGISEVVEREGNAITSLVYDYLNHPDNDEASRAELERLLRIIFPPEDVLERISEQSRNLSSLKLASFKPRNSQQIQNQCEDFAGTGYSEENLGNTCYYYRERNLDGRIVRVYYPEWWQEDEEKQNLIGITEDALGKSVITYSSFDDLELRNISLVFAIIPGNAGNTLNGVTSNFEISDQNCPITMYPRAAERYSTEIYQQIVAHEVFHCVQRWTFTSVTTIGPHRWWREGTAHYFSNLVYPEANREWSYLNYFDSRSRAKQLFDMKYENFAFFQFMGNKYSNEVLIDILMRISSAGGRAGQEEALAAVSGMDANFNLFVVQFLSTGIQDTGGGRIQTTPEILYSGARTIDDKGEVVFTLVPFVARRYKVTYDQEKRFLQNAQNPDDVQFSGVERKLRENIASWSDLPPELRSSCDDDVEYLFVPTTTKPNTIEYQVEVTEMQEASCDPCLLGTWDVDPVSYAQAMEGLMSQVDTGDVSIKLLVRGHEYLQFGTEGKVYTQRDDFAIIANGIVTTTINGFGSGNYSANGEELSVTNFLDTADSVGISLFGSNDPTQFTGPNLNKDNTPQNRTAPYSCEQDQMTLTIPELGDLEFHRVDKILSTPIPTPESPENPQP